MTGLSIVLWDISYALALTVYRSPSPPCVVRWTRAELPRQLLAAIT